MNTSLYQKIGIVLVLGASVILAITSKCTTPKQPYIAGDPVEAPWPEQASATNTGQSNMAIMTSTIKLGGGVKDTITRVVDCEARIICYVVEGEGFSRNRDIACVDRPFQHCK